MSNLPAGFEGRAPRPDDIEGVLSLIREHEQADEGEAESTLDDLRGTWGRARFDLEKDAWVVIDPDGRVAGYADVWDRVPGETFVADGYVSPQSGGRGIGRFLVRSAEARARQRAAPGGRATVSHTISHGAQAAAGLLRAEGYVPVQHYWRMVLLMSSQPPAPATPEGVRIRPFVPEKDDRAVWEVVQGAFSDNREFTPKPFEEWSGFMVERESFDPSLYFVADADGDVAGVALCPRFEEWGWVRQLAVRRRWRRKGVARALMQTAFAEFYRRGYRKVGLVVDSYNRTDARKFYESLDMRVERQHDRYEKELGARS